LDPFFLRRFSSRRPPPHFPPRPRQLWAQPWWVNLLILIPVAAVFTFQRTGRLLGGRQLVVLNLFAAAFGFVEASVVVYLRAAIGMLPG